jgi:hypothetical protein
MCTFLLAAAEMWLASCGGRIEESWPRVSKWFALKSIFIEFCD